MMRNATQGIITSQKSVGLVSEELAAFENDLKIGSPRIDHIDITTSKKANH